MRGHRFLKTLLWRLWSNVLTLLHSLIFWTCFTPAGALVEPVPAHRCRKCTPGLIPHTQTHTQTWHLVSVTHLRQCTVYNQLNDACFEPTLTMAEHEKSAQKEMQTQAPFAVRLECYYSTYCTEQPSLLLFFCGLPYVQLLVWFPLLDWFHCVLSLWNWWLMLQLNIQSPWKTQLLCFSNTLRSAGTISAVSLSFLES